MNTEPKRIPTAKSSIELYEAMARKYDLTAKQHSWLPPDVAFGLVFEYIKPRQKLLDVGCGTGLSSKYFSKVGVETYGIDGSKNMIKEFRKKGFAKELKVIDLNDGKYPYPDKFFDQVISVGGFSFFRTLEPFIQESYRVLKDGGIFSFNVEELRGNEKNEYSNIDNAVIFKDMLKETGVKIYRHNFEQIINLLKKHNFETLKTLNYHAFKSPSIGKDIYSTVFVARRLKI